MVFVLKYQSCLIDPSSGPKFNISHIKPRSRKENPGLLIKQTFILMIVSCLTKLPIKLTFDH